MAQDLFGNDYALLNVHLTSSNLITPQVMFILIIVNHRLTPSSIVFDVLNMCSDVLYDHLKLGKGIYRLLKEVL